MSTTRQLGTASKTAHVAKAEKGRFLGPSGITYARSSACSLATDRLANANSLGQDIRRHSTICKGAGNQQNDLRFFSWVLVERFRFFGFWVAKNDPSLGSRFKHSNESVLCLGHCLKYIFLFSILILPN
jgi:hypothetical protein